MLSERMQRRVDSLLDDAEQGIERLDWTTVEDRCNAVLAIDPGNGDARGYLAAVARAVVLERWRRAASRGWRGSM